MKMEDKSYCKTVNEVIMKAIHTFGNLTEEGNMTPMWVVVVRDFGAISITATSITITKHEIEYDMVTEIKLPKYNINKYVVEDDETTAEMVFEIAYGLVIMVRNFTFNALR